MISAAQLIHGKCSAETAIVQRFIGATLLFCGCVAGRMLASAERARYIDGSWPRSGPSDLPTRISPPPVARKILTVRHRSVNRQLLIRGDSHPRSAVIQVVLFVVDLRSISHLACHGSEETMSLIYV